MRLILAHKALRESDIKRIFLGVLCIISDSFLKIFKVVWANVQNILKFAKIGVEILGKKGIFQPHKPS